MIDTGNKPIGWVAHGDIPADGGLSESMANPSSPVLNKRTTLKDALSMMLDAAVQTGVVVDRNQAVQGLLTVEAVAQKMREGEHATEFGDLALLGEPGEAEDLDPGDADRAALEGV